MSRALEQGVPVTRITTQPESELDRQLRARTHHDTRSIAELAWGVGSGVNRISARTRLASALALDGVSRPDERATMLVRASELGLHTDAAPRISPGNRPLVEALLEAADTSSNHDGTILVSALVSAGVSVNLEAPGNLRRAAERLGADGDAHDAFCAWCEYARRSRDEDLTDGGRPAEPIGARIVDLALAARGKRGSPAAPAPNPVAAADSRISIFAGAAASMSSGTFDVTQALLTRAIAHYDGLILTGGTTAGIAGAVRAAAQAAELSVVGYAPAGHGEPGAGVTLRDTEVPGGAGESEPFSEREPLAMWTDILDSGFAATNVRVVGFPGGPITRSELVFARALGAEVAWLDPCSDSELALDDELPLGAEGVLELPPDPMTLWAFLSRPVTLPDGWPTEAIARYLHNDYRAKHRDKKPLGDPATAPWERLLPSLQRSNRAAASDIPNKLEVIGKRLAKGGHRLRLTPEEVELLAELEHGRYNYERLSAGWQLGERQVLRLLNPSLKPWDELTNEVKQWDRDSVCNIDPALAQAGWGVEDA